MNDKLARRRLAILDVLKQRDRPVISSDIARDLQVRGHDLSERTVRLYLQGMDHEGITLNEGRRGHRLSASGLAELRNARTAERVGFLSAKIDAMTYSMSFDLATRAGTVVVNTTVCEPRQLREALPEIETVFAKGYAMGTLVSLIEPGDRVGDVAIPPGRIGFCTVCSITLNGVLLKHGVPTRSRFGGLLELRDGVATRFAEAITYDGTSIDPLVVFIRGGFTDYRGAIHSGNGLIGASFREIPAASRDLALNLARKVAAIGLGGFMEIGPPGCELFGIHSSEGCCGAIVIGGLNPVSIMEERGEHVLAHALSGLIEYNRLFSYTELGTRLGAMRIR